MLPVLRIIRTLPVKKERKEGIEKRKERKRKYRTTLQRDSVWS